MSDRATTGHTPPRFGGNIDFNAQHSPMGAFFSFTCGHRGSGGGMAAESGRPADQSVFVGVKRGDRKAKSPLVCLPFVRGGAGSGAGAGDYQVEQTSTATRAPANVQVYAAEQIARHYGWATDAWTTPDLTFTVHTPFGPIPEPGVAAPDELRAALLPAVVATLRVDNRGGDVAKTAVFAIDFRQPGARVFDGGEPAAGGAAAVGFGWRRHLGILATCADAATECKQPFAFQRWSVSEAIAADTPVHALGTCAGVALEVPPGADRTLVIAIGAYLDGVVTTGLEGRYLYARHYTGLLDVLTAALARASDLRAHAAQLDARLLASHLSADQQFLVAHATRSYYGSTQLLDVGGRPCWVVNEGEYCMMNTLDLSIDHAFWELDRNPWVVRNLLDHFAHRYSYADELQGRGGQRLPGGVAFTHDMGVNNHFSPPGHSSYELPGLTGCFSYMTAEQLCNWVLLAACYVARTGDDDWLRRAGPTVRACLDSLVARGGETGLVQFDSARCAGGQEITTYDSLDHSLAQTRNNVYMAVKCWAGYVGLALLADALGDDEAASVAADSAARVAATVVAHAGPDGVIPAVFEPNNPGHASRILPACEGLIYPLYWRRCGYAPRRLAQLLASPESTALTAALRRHVHALLLDPQGRNLFPDGGLRLSSTSANSWMSKIALLQHVARELFDADTDPALRSVLLTADAAHVKWQTDGSGYWACSDQFVNGEAKGSRYYPRVITAALWLDERPERRVGGDAGAARTPEAAVAEH